MNSEFRLKHSADLLRNIILNIIDSEELPEEIIKEAYKLTDICEEYLFSGKYYGYACTPEKDRMYTAPVEVIVKYIVPNDNG